jgi:hypothetical protein
MWLSETIGAGTEYGVSAVIYGYTSLDVQIAGNFDASGGLTGSVQGPLSPFCSSSASMA